MSAVFDESETTPPLPAWRTALGWILIGAACFFAVVIAVKADNAYMAGRALGRVLTTGLFIGILSWAVTYNRSLGTKANARIVAGVLLLLTTFFGNGNGNGAREKEIGIKFMQDGIALKKQHEKRFELLGERIAKADFSDVLAPATVTTTAGIASSRAKVAQYRSFIAERGAVLQMNIEEGKSLVRNLPPSEIKEGAESGLEETIKETGSIFNDLDRAELTKLAFIEKILDWCASQGNKLRHEHGQFLFTSKAQEAQFQTFLDELQKIELEVGYASKAFERKAAQFAKMYEGNLKEGRKLLGD